MPWARKRCDRQPRVFMTKIAAYVADMPAAMVKMSKQNLTRTLRWVGGGGGSDTCNKGPNKTDLRKFCPLPASNYPCRVPMKIGQNCQ